MERYTWIELANMHLAYGTAFTSGRAAQRLYRDRYPNRRVARRITHHTFPAFFVDYANRGQYTDE